MLEQCEEKLKFESVSKRFQDLRRLFYVLCSRGQELPTPVLALWLDPLVSTGHESRVTNFESQITRL
jgi:hypothetical protein